jgi:hypothetical protein
MGVFDQAARFATKAAPEPVLRRLLARTKTPLRFMEWADTRTLPKLGASDRTADLVAILEDTAQLEALSLMVVEFQTRHDPDKLDVTLEEVARLRLHARHGPDRRGKYRVLTGLIYLQGTCPESSLDMTLPEGFGTRHAALVWNVEEDSADAALSAVEADPASWGVLFWIALMAGGDDPAMMARWKTLVLAVSDGRRRGDLGKIALVFAGLVGRAVAWKQALEGFDMTESEVVNEWIEEAVNKKGLEDARRFLMKLLRQRFAGPVPPEVIETINAQPSQSMLEHWFDQAGQVATMADFIQVLRT